MPTGTTPRPRPNGFGGQGAYNNRAPIGRPGQTPSPPRVTEARPFTQSKPGTGNRGTRGSGFQQLMRENGVTSNRGLRGGRGFGGGSPRPQATTTPTAPNADQPLASPRTQAPRSPLDRIPSMGLPGTPFPTGSPKPFHNSGLGDVATRLPYPGQFPLGAIGNGGQLTEGSPAVSGEPGLVAGAAYSVQWSTEDYPTYARSAVNTYTGLIGPVTQSTGTDFGWWGGPSLQWKDFAGANGVSVRVTITRWFIDGTVQFRNGQGGLVRADGGVDPPAQEEILPTYAPNPIRGRIAPVAVPDILPQVPDFFPSPTTWPNRPANPDPAKQPLPYIPTEPSPIRPDEYVNDPDAPANDPTRPQFNPDGTPKTTPSTGSGLGKALAPSKLGQGVGAPSPATGRRSQRDQIVVPIVITQGQTQPPETPVDRLVGPNFRPNTGSNTTIKTPPVVQIPPGAPTGPRPPGVCLFDDSRILSRVKDVHDGIGIDDLPVSVPDQIAKQNPAQKTIPTLTALQLWQVEQLDGVMGRWPQQIGFPTPAGNVNVGMPNVSEAIAEIVGMLLSQQVTASQILHTSSRTLAQAGSATQQAHLAHLMSKANAEFMGYEGRPAEVDMPLAYSPGSDPGEGLLQESVSKIKGWQNTDGTDMKAIFAELLHAASIIRAVFWRRLNPRDDFQKQIKDRVKGQSDFTEDTRTSPTNDNDWEQYLKDIEEGFRKVTGDSSPYGRNPSEGPKIRDISPEDGG